MKETVSASDIFESLNNHLKDVGDEKVKDEIMNIINDFKSTKNIKLKKNASRLHKPKWLDMFLNVILDLLEVDNKHGRIFACHILRKLCPVLSSDQIIQLLSVVIHFNDGDDVESDVDNLEFDTEGDNEEFEHLNVSDDESESDADDALKIPNLESLKETMMASFDTSDINLDDVPPEELEKFDNRLLGLMKALHGKLPDDEAKEMKRQALLERDVRFRGCDLIKVLVKEAVNPTHLIILVIPLLEAIQSKEDKEFSSVFIKICGELVDVTEFRQNDDLTAVLAGQELKRLLYMSNKNIEVLVKRCVRFLIKTGQQSTSNTVDECKLKPIFDVVAQAIEELFTDKTCPVKESVLRIPLALMKDDFLPLCDIIRKHAFSKNSKNIKKSIALNLLVNAYQQRTMMVEASQEKLKEFQVTVSSNMNKILNSITRPNQIQAAYMLDFFHLLKCIYIFHMKENDCKVGFDWDSVKSSMKLFGAKFSKKKLSTTLAKSFSVAANTIQIKQAHMKGQKKFNSTYAKKSKNKMQDSKEKFKKSPSKNITKLEVKIFTKKSSQKKRNKSSTKTSKSDNEIGAVKKCIGNGIGKKKNNSEKKKKSRK